MARVKKKRKLNSVFIRCFLLVFFCAIGIGTFSQIQEYKRVCAERELIAATMDQERERTVQLEERKNLYQSDSYIEQVAREQLGMVKPNEVLYVNRAQ